MAQAFHGGRLNEARAKFGHETFLDYSVNTNAFWHSPGLPGAVVLSDAMGRYPEADAHTLALRIGELYEITESQILATAGAIEGLYLATRLFSGRRAAIFAPSFADYHRACLAAGVTVLTVPIFPEVPDGTSLPEVLSGVDVVLVGNPNNPTGLLFPNLEKLIQQPELAGISWIIDEAFIEFTEGTEQRSLLKKLAVYPNVILLRAFTKSWSIPGLRLGFLATSNAAWMKQLQLWQPPWPISGIAEAWALLHLNKNNQKAMLASLKQLPEVRAEFMEQIRSLDLFQPLTSHANFFLLQTNSINALQLAETLAHQGVLIRACHGFENLRHDRYARLAVRTRQENEKVVHALAKAAARKFRVRSSSKKPAMRSISVLGTSSNSGKSWFTTALCAWLKKRGLRVAPFKAQNMSNNSAVAFDGGEIGRAQAAQAEACGLFPSVRMNPILLKPAGKSGSQLVRLGRAEGHIKAADYYKAIESLWPTVAESLAYWENRCDVLILEGAGSPVELNLMQRDLVNLRPIRHLNSRWLLVADIERGGVFSQAAGTWSLTPAEDRARCLGLIVNKFRGDLGLFSEVQKFFAPHFGAPFLGTLPYVQNLQPENEDSLSLEPSNATDGEPLHWIRLPQTSNSQDTNPWQLDEGVCIQWTEDPMTVARARVIVLPGSKNTLADLRWLKRTGLAAAILKACQHGAVVVGICGGFQMLGERISDPEGLAGDAGEEAGLSLLPLETWFTETKEVRNIEAIFEGQRWNAYEIHMGKSRMTASCPPLLQISDSNGPREEGCRRNNVWGTYVHGLFESSHLRRELVRAAKIKGHKLSLVSFRDQREILYKNMADLLDQHLNMEEIWRYVAD